MNYVARSIVFFIGWLLSPLTWWNDVFVNIPLSYLLASLLCVFLKHPPFVWLVVGCYWLTNGLGLAMMYAGGKEMVKSSTKQSKQAIILICVFVIIYSAAMFYLDKSGRLPPLGKLLKHKNRQTVVNDR